jgi:hypothetical protein
MRCGFVARTSAASAFAREAKSLFWTVWKTWLALFSNSSRLCAVASLMMSPPR